jgi:hypothetical protein
MSPDQSVDGGGKVDMDNNDRPLRDRIPTTRVPPGDGAMTRFGEMLATDHLAKVDAGAALVYALYHSGASEWWKHVPEPVLQAYMQAQKAYRVGHHA